MDIEVDDDGWAAIHHCVAAEKELLMSIEKFVATNPENLEFETRDRLKRTPFLLAVHFNKKKSVEKLLSLGANIKAIDNYNHGAIEICVNNDNINLLHFFIDLQNDDLNVWSRIIGYLGANTDEETEKASQMINRLTLNPHARGSEVECMDQHWEQLVQANGIPALIKACRLTSLNTVKVNVTNILRNLVSCNSVPTVMVKAGAIELMLELLKANVKSTFEPVLTCLEQIAKFSNEFAKKVQGGGFLVDSIKLLQHSRLSPESLTNIILVIGHIASVSSDTQKAVGNTLKMFDNLFMPFEKAEYQTNVPLLTALTRTLENIVDKDTDNQNAAIDAGAASHLLMISRANKYRELQISAIKALYALTAGNQYASNSVLEEGGVMSLMQLLKKTRAVTMQEALARTLWSLAGPRTSERNSMATMIGVDLLIEFLSAQGENSDNLNCIGCDGLTVLSQGALTKQKEICDANGIVPLVRLLRSANSTIVKSSLRALRCLCLNIGYIPNPHAQTSISQTRGLKLLITLLAHSKSEDIQVEAALTIAAAVSGHNENIAQLEENTDFTYLHVIRLLYSDNKLVRLQAGNALATFSYNSVSQQQEIAQCGGVRWHNFSEFLHSKDDFFSLSAAFQAVVMSRIIPDEEPAISSACGINILVGVLERTESEDISSLAADCVARLAHTRAGVPSAMVAVEVVSHLFKLLNVTSEQVRGAAAIALGYLSFDPSAERQILRECRQQPNLVHVVKYYTKNYKLSPTFIEGWKHSVRVANIETNKTEMMKTLSGGLSGAFLKEPKSITTPLISLTEETGRQESSHMHGSRTSQILASMRDDASQIYGRSSHSSRITQLSPNVRSRRSNFENQTPSVLSN